MLDRAEFAALVLGMKLGDKITAQYMNVYGTLPPLMLLAALRATFQKRGGTHLGSLSVSGIEPQGNRMIMIVSSKCNYQCKKLVIAAGHGSSRLLAALGQKLHVYPQRGQLIVTERVKTREFHR